MSELLNHNELAAIVTSAPVTYGHAALLDALHGRYPRAGFRLVGERKGRTWQPGIIDREGNRVTDSLGKWIDKQLEACNGSARSVWEQYKDSGLVRTEWSGSVIYLTAPYGSGPDAFFQLEVLVGEEVTTRQMFDPSPWAAPSDRFELVSGGVQIDEEEQRILSPPRYQFDALINVRKYLRELLDVEMANKLAQLPEMEKKIVHVHKIYPGPEGGQTSQEIPFLEMCPDWLDRVPPAIRFFQDWQESSAGKSGVRLCDHWFIQTTGWKDSEGRRYLSMIPQWADVDGGLDLPQILPDWEASPYGVMESLSQFDQQVGYPFAWYFYMLHGNRIGHSAGSVVANAVRENKLRLPSCDEGVLLRWDARKYGF
ncbi:MAG: hypothetical protein EG828_11745 [Deltaproteobacteria bacterium]|nr:hypothetical protein [Deltaproteobacteria bacterium]